MSFVPDEPLWRTVANIAGAAAFAWLAVFGLPRAVLYYFLEASASECPKKYVASILECDASGCVVLLLDGTKGRAKFPVKYAEVSEVCPL